MFPSHLYRGCLARIAVLLHFDEDRFGPGAAAQQALIESITDSKNGSFAPPMGAAGTAWTTLASAA
jgi:hypothetical protein